MSEPDPQLPRRRRKALGFYFGLSIVTTSAASAVLSILGYITFDVPTALLAGVIAGFAIALFQLSYLRFVGHTTYRLSKQEPLPE